MTYRDNANKSVKEPAAPQGEYICGGKLKRHGIKNDHDCQPPGRWARWWSKVHLGDKWTCTCGTRWEFVSWKHSSLYVNGDFVNGRNNAWVTTSGAYRP